MFLKIDLNRKVFRFLKPLKIDGNLIQMPFFHVLFEMEALFTAVIRCEPFGEVVVTLKDTKSTWLSDRVYIFLKMYSTMKVGRLVKGMKLNEGVSLNTLSTIFSSFFVS